MKIFGKCTCTVIAAGLAASVWAVPAGAEEKEDSKGVVILHVNDVHCGIESDENTFGYAELVAYEAGLRAEGYETILADAGDFVQGDVIGTLSQGEYIVDIMNKAGFDVATLGNHEFDYGMDTLKKLADKADFDIVSSNFTDASTGKSVFDGWEIITAGDVKIGFVGITTPQTLTSSRPSNFMDENGNYIYDFCSGENGKELYKNVQNSVDGARKAGADYVVALTHLGVDDGNDNPFSSVNVIGNTTGIDAVIDGHSHSVIDDRTVKNKDGENVILASTGTKMANIGTVTITNKGISAKLVGKSDYSVSEDKDSAEYKAYAGMNDYIGEIKDSFEALANKTVAKTDVPLISVDTDTGDRIVRMQETNLGDLCADAYREIIGSDIAFVNGGGVRANIAEGDITYGNLVSVFPFGNMLCEVEATGQEILDALEVGASFSPEPSGGFLQVSGLTYEIHNYIPSSVVFDDKGMFVSVDGEYRVKNVRVNGEPLELDKTYTVASHNYLLKSGGDGMVMFADNNFTQDEVILDNQALISYIAENLGGVVGDEYSDPEGDGRITVFAEAPAETGESTDTAPETAETDTAEGTESGSSGTHTAAGEENPDSGVRGIAIIPGIILLAIAGAAAKRTRK